MEILEEVLSDLLAILLVIGIFATITAYDKVNQNN